MRSIYFQIIYYDQVQGGERVIFGDFLSEKKEKIWGLSHRPRTKYCIGIKLWLGDKQGDGKIATSNVKMTSDNTSWCDI